MGAVVAAGRVAVALADRMSDFAVCYAGKLVFEISLWGSEHGDVHACCRGGGEGRAEGLAFGIKRIMAFQGEIA